jgi:hypothetical protein
VKENTINSNSETPPSTTKTGFLTESPRVNDQIWAETTTAVAAAVAINSPSPLPIRPPASSHLGSVQSLYLPTLLSYDPIQSVTPGHTALLDSSRPPSNGSQEDELDRNGPESRPILKSSLKRGMKGPQVESPDPIGPKILSLPVPDVELDAGE